MKKNILILLLFCLLLAGCSAQQIAIPPSLKDQLMISHVKEPAISFVNLQTHHITASDLGYRITAMQKVANHQVILAGENEEYLFTLDFTEGNVKKLYQAGKGINSLLHLSKHNLLLFSNGNNNSIGFFDLTQRKATAEVPVGDQPISMAYHPQQELLYVLNAKSATVSVVDIDAKTEVYQFPVLARPNGIYFDGRYVWIGGHGASGTLNKYVYVYDPENGKEIDRVEAGVMPVDFYGDDSSPYVYVICHGSSSVYRINKDDRTVSRPIAVGNNPYDITGDQQHIYVTSIDGDSLTVIERSTFKLVKAIQITNGPHLMILGEKDE